MRDLNYWERLQRARLTRRRLLGGAAALGAGAAGLAIVGCGGGEEGGEAGPTATPSLTQNQPARTRGGIFRSFTFDALALDTYDPHQTQFGPMYNMHSCVFSKVLQYESDIDQIMSPDLADGMPEQPDELTYVIRLRQGVKFHDSPRARQNFPQVAGRELTAEDVRFSIERQINENSPQKALYYRAGHWKTIDTLEVMDPYTIRIKTKSPTAPFLHFLADRNAHIVAKETVDANDTMNSDKAMIGTGPFFLEEFKAVEVVKVRRNPEWFAKDDRPDLGLDRPYLDGYDSLWTPQSDSTQEQALLSRQVDGTGFEDDSNTMRVLNENPGKLVLQEAGTAGWLNSRLWLSTKSPFQDFRLRKALHLAIDRKTLGEQLFPAAPGQRGFLVCGPVAWPMHLWALPQTELEARPGYRSDPAGREEDIAEARKLWQEAGGPSTLKIIFAGVPNYIPQKALPEMKRQLQEFLGVTVEDEVDATGYTTLAQCLLRNTADADSGTCVFTWGFDNGWIDLDDWVYPYFHTGGTKNSFLLSDPKLDEMLDAQRAEFNYERRRQIGFDIQNYLLDNVLCRLDYFAPAGRSLIWSYVKNAFTASWFGHNYLFANVWLDQNDPNYAGRPA